MKITRTLPALVAPLLLLAACGSDDSASDSTTAPIETADSSATSDSTAQDMATSDTMSSDTTATRPASDTTEPSSSGATTEPVNINTATIDEMTAAFESAGVTNAGRWAFEVDEYRPYSEDDTDFAKLRQELGKYNIDPAELELIISVLTY